MNYFDKMFKKAKNAMDNAYVPLCKFPVGACLRTPENQLFFGCNWENAAIPLSQCAETTAISAMISNGFREILDMVIVTNENTICTPCGACRQRLYEFADENMKIYLCSQDGTINKVITLGELLPHPFKFKVKKQL